jgi:hypothetical protein
MSFFVTLPSNASAREFPSNIISDYTTKLANPIYLDGTWEVGLVEILYPNSILDDLSGEISIQTIINADKQTEKYSEPIIAKIGFKPGETLASLANNIARSFHDKNVQIRLEIKENRTKINFNRRTIHEIRLEPRLAAILGFSDHILPVLDMVSEIVSTSPPDVIEIGELFVYTDIITHQFIGDTKAKVLRVVAVETALKSSKKHFSKLYDTPHYVPLERNNIETIKINIRDKTGNTIRFANGAVIVKLHFRKHFF